MAGKVQCFVDLAGKDGVPHVFMGLTNSAGLTTYSGYAGVTTALVNAGKVFTGLADRGLGVAGHMDQVSYANPQFVVSDAQVVAMQARSDQLALNPGTYILLGHNCATYVQDVFSAGGVSLPLTGSSLGLFAHPVNFIPWADKAQFFIDNFGNPATSGNLNDKAKNPQNYPDTPAYQFLSNGGVAAPVSNPATSESITTNLDGSITLSATFQDGQREYETTSGGELHDLLYGANGRNLTDQYADVYSDGRIQSYTFGTANADGTTQVTTAGFDSAGAQKIGAVVIIGNGIFATRSSFGMSLINDFSQGFADTVTAQLASFGIGINSRGVVYQRPRGAIHSMPSVLSANAISASAASAMASHAGAETVGVSMLESAHGTTDTLGRAHAWPFAVGERAAHLLPITTRNATSEGQVHPLLSAMATFHFGAAASTHFVPALHARDHLLAASPH